MVVFERAALERLDDPARAVADARTWSDRVGVFDEDRDRVRAFLDAVGADPDFVTGTAGLQSSLGLVRHRNPTERHLLIGPEDGDRETAESVGWEYLTVRAAADAADWSLE